MFKPNCLSINTTITSIKVGMVVPKSTQTRVVGKITHNVHPCTTFLSNRVSRKNFV